MRVLHLTTEFPPVIYGGLGTAVGGLVLASRQAGVDARVLLFDAAAAPRSYSAPATTARGEGALTGEDIAIFSFNENLDVVARSVSVTPPDLIHLHSFWLASHALQLKEKLGIPLVYTVHSLDKAEYEIGEGPPECLSQWVQQEEVIRVADRVVALSQDERQLIDGYCPQAASRVRIVGNGIDDIAVRRRRRTGPPVVLFAGRFVERKGLWDFLQAIPLIEQRCPGLCYALAGGHRGVSAEEMAAWLVTPELQAVGANIRFTGWLSPEAMAREYAAADILVVPSWYEPFGMVVLEGMLHGLAVAASAVGGPMEILQGSGAGRLFPPRDPSALADCVADLANRPRLRRDLAKHGGRWVRERWLWPNIFERMRKVYCEATAERSPPLPVDPSRPHVFN